MKRLKQGYSLAFVLIVEMNVRENTHATCMSTSPRDSANPQGGQRMYRPWFLSKDQQDSIISMTIENQSRRAFLVRKLMVRH